MAKISKTVLIRGASTTGNNILQDCNLVDYYLTGAVYYGDNSPSQIVFLIPDDGNLNYGEVHVTWDDAVLPGWVNDVSIQSIRQTQEYSYFQDLRQNGITVVRYLPFDDSAVDPEYRDISEYVNPGYNLVVAP